MLRTLFLMGLCAAGLSTRAQTVKLDYYFNHETRKTANGKAERFHYLWNETDNSGFSIWADVFQRTGFTLDTLGTAPRAENLKGTSVYLIVDPDTKKEAAAPNYIQKEDVAALASWVKAGGVLVMLANDSANVELKYFNTLAGKFGMHFNNDLCNHVVDDAHFEDGAIDIKSHAVFVHTKKIFMKDVCSISTTEHAVPMLKNNGGATVIAYAEYGKGKAVAVADPWLYNEYVNGRLPAGFDNENAAKDFTAWLKRLIR